MAILDELLVGLGFDYDPKEMSQFKKDLDTSIKSIKSLAKVAVTGAAAITGLTVASTAATDEQGKLASEIGETVENVDALQFALKIAGGSSEGMSTSLRQLSIRASEAARGMGSGVEAFGLLGVSATDAQGNVKKTSDLMLEVSQRFKGLGKSQQIELADKLGIRDSILLLQQGPKAIKELTDEAAALGVTTGEDAKAAAEFQDSLTKVWQVTKQITRLFSKSLAPILQETNDKFVDWWKANKDIIQQNLPIWIEKAARVFKVLTVAVLGSLAVLFAVPIILGTIIAAFAGLTEDAKVFFEGGESFIGDMIDKFPKWADELRVIAAVFATIAKLTGMIFDGWSNITDLFDNFSLEGFKEVINNIPGFFKHIIGKATGQSPSTNGEEGVPPKQTDNQNKTIETGFNPEVINTIMIPTPELPLAPSNGATSNSSNTTVEKMEIVVQGGGDSAENIANAVHNVFQQTSQDLNSGVDQ